MHILLSVLRNSLVLCLIAMASLTEATEALAGARSSGGGIYAKVGTEWILLDRLEQGQEIYPQKESYFKSVEEILRQVEDSVPAFGQQLRSILTNKSWHLISYELKCESPDTLVSVDTMVVGCQDDNDIWIEEKSFKRVDKKDLILHELIQGVRLANNKYLKLEEKIPPASVRGIFRILSAANFPSDERLSQQLTSYGFGVYQPASVLLRNKQLEQARVDEAIKFARERMIKRVDQWLALLEWGQGSSVSAIVGNPLTYEELTARANYYNERSEFFDKSFSQLTWLLVGDSNADELQKYSNRAYINQILDGIRRDLLSSRHLAIDAEIARYQGLKNILLTLTHENISSVAGQVKSHLKRGSASSAPVDLSE